MKIQGRHFVITGGNRGIGLAVAEMAAEQGAHVYIAARSWEPHLEARLKEQGAASVTFLKSDLSSREGVDQLSRALNKIEVDILFNNAGVLTGGLLETQSLDEIYSVVQVNLTALVHLTHQVLPGMLQRGHGKIINNSSVSAYMHFPCASTYAATKSAVMAFTDCLDMELKGTGVSTLALVTPGIKTRMFDAIETKYSQNLQIPQDSISPEAYARQIQRAIESDASRLLPGGATAVGLSVARFINPLFRAVVRGKFQR